MSRRLAAPLLAVLFALVAPARGWAHPLGNFTVNHYSRLEPAADGLRVVYVLDMAEIPTFQEQERLDVDRDGQISDWERERYADARAEELRRNLRLTLNGAPASLRLLQRSLSFPPGQGGLPLLRLEAVYGAELPRGTVGAVDVGYRDDNGLRRIGWQEIVAAPGAADTVIQQASVPAQDQSDELRVYPQDLLSSPLNVREAQLTFVPGALAAAPLSGAAPGAVERAQDLFATLAAAEELSPSVIVLALAMALALGALHSLSPGHGKTVVAAYLVGSRATARHAVFLGTTVTATHTSSVYALGLVTLSLSEYVVPERLYPILQLVSGLLVLAMGGVLLVIRLRGALARGEATSAGYSRGGAEMCCAKPLALVAAGAASAGHHHGGTPLVQHHGGHAHTPLRLGAVAHRHGGHAHTHLPPGADDRPAGWRSTLAMGFSGGLVPCPSALLVLLSAIALHRVAFGLVLIVAFSVGVGSMLVGIGLVAVYARRFFTQQVSLGGGLVGRVLPVASALVVVATGVGLTLQALPQAR